MYKARVDEGLCAAHGDCVDIAPEVFELNETHGLIGDGRAELLMEAAETCPSVAIIVIDDETGEQIYP